MCKGQGPVFNDDRVATVSASLLVAEEKHGALRGGDIDTLLMKP